MMTWKRAAGNDGYEAHCRNQPQQDLRVMTHLEAISAAMNEVLGPVMARPERMEQALMGRKDLCDRLAAAACSNPLIAAAPDLLVACEGAAEWLKGWGSAEPYLGVLRAAIAKATGEP
jgi:hypothetical protein